MRTLTYHYRSGSSWNSSSSTSSTSRPVAQLLRNWPRSSMERTPKSRTLIFTKSRRSFIPMTTPLQFTTRRRAYRLNKRQSKWVRPRFHISVISVSIWIALSLAPSGAMRIVLKVSCFYVSQVQYFELSTLALINSERIL